MVVARHVDGAWQVRGPSVTNSVHDVEPVTEEQSDVCAQTTAYLRYSFLILPDNVMLTIQTYI